MTRHPLVVVALPGGGGDGEPRREGVLTYGRGSQAWEPKLGHEGARREGGVRDALCGSRVRR